MKRITFNVPTVDGIETREGFRVWLSVGPWRRAFVLQCEGSGFVLTDWASGFKLCDLRGAMLRNFVGRPSVHDSSLAAWRREAQLWLVEAAGRKGLSTINAKLNSV